MTTVYKITRQQGERHFSLCSPEALEVEYILKEKTIPLEGMYLLAFASFKDAIEYSQSGDVWEAEAEVVGVVSCLLPLGTTSLMPKGFSRVEDFWQFGYWQDKKSGSFITFTAPPGTVACSSITLKKKVKK